MTSLCSPARPARPRRDSCRPWTDETDSSGRWVGREMSTTCTPLLSQMVWPPGGDVGVVTVHRDVGYFLRHDAAQPPLADHLHVGIGGRCPRGRGGMAQERTTSTARKTRGVPGSPNQDQILMVTASAVMCHCTTTTVTAGSISLLELPERTTALGHHHAPRVRPRVHHHRSAHLRPGHPRRRPSSRRPIRCPSAGDEGLSRLLGERRLYRRAELTVSWCHGRGGPGSAGALPGIEVNQSNANEVAWTLADLTGQPAAEFHEARSGEAARIGRKGTRRDGGTRVGRDQG